jgi:arylsulfatase A-like enzyme
MITRGMPSTLRTMQAHDTPPAAATTGTPRPSGSGTASLVTTLGAAFVLAWAAAPLGESEAAVRDGCPAAGAPTEACPPERAAAAGDRNILLIIADDLGIDAATLYPAASRLETEPPAPPTPHLIELARHGILFRNAWANPSCSPTRATILTGRYGFRTGMGWPIPPRNFRQRVPPPPIFWRTAPPLSVDEFTLPEAIAAGERGRRYLMALVGKWHESTGPSDPVRHGWPDFTGPDPSEESGAIRNFFRWPKVVDGSVRMSTTYATTDTVDETLRRIRAARDEARPYFLWVAFNAVHQPFHRPPDYLHSRHELPATGAPKRAYYEAMVEALDNEVGRLLRGVDLTDTTVIFIGDNGTPRDVIAEPYDARHGKLSLYEDGIRVPLLIAGAGVAAPGRTVDGLAQGVDLYPTILELAGVDPQTAVPEGTQIDGVSLVPYLENEEAPPVRAVAYSEQFVLGDYRNRFERTIRNDRFKYIERAPGLGVPEREFFDLDADPHERANLLSKEIGPAERQELNELARSLRALLATRCDGPCVMDAAGLVED